MISSKNKVLIEFMFSAPFLAFFGMTPTEIHDWRIEVENFEEVLNSIKESSHAVQRTMNELYDLVHSSIKEFK